MAVSNSTAGEASASSGGQQPSPAPPTTKRRRNLPGMPDPDAEVVALSPKTLMATNRFVCEICNKGFQRDQNLQLHRRGHNLPWKLRQRSGKEPRKRVYVCPEPSCVHHDPSRALGDLTGIKKHFCRKHGEKKFECERCSKKYAVQSDWRAHSKTCGSREYRCDCGTVFSRKDSFVTHRAFCDALAVENAKAQPAIVEEAVGEANPRTSDEERVATTVASPSSSSSSPAVVSTGLSVQQSPPAVAEEKPQKELENTEQSAIMQHIPAPTPSPVSGNNSGNGSSSTASTSASSSTTSTSMFASFFASPSSTALSTMMTASTSRTDPEVPLRAPTSALACLEPTSLCLSRCSPTLFSSPLVLTPPSAHMSATALLQKAAQMGPTATNPSLLLGFGLAPPTSTSPSHRENNPQASHERRPLHHPEQEPPTGISASLGLGLLPYGYDGGGALTRLVMSQPALFGTEPATLDLLGLGMCGPGGAAGGSGLSALITSMGGGYEVGEAASPAGLGLRGTAAKPWEGSERAPDSSAFL